MTLFEKDNLPKRKINGRSVVREALNSFNEFQDGVIEGLKNSNDIYVDFEIQRKDKRDIIIFIKKNTRNIKKVSFAILDFGGMSKSAIENFFDWMNPRREKRGSLHGHGNGGKSFLLKFFKSHSIATYHDGLAHKSSIKGLEEKDDNEVGGPEFEIYNNEIIENKEPKKNTNKLKYSMVQFLDLQLKNFDFDSEKLRNSFPWVNDMFETRNGFTIVGGEAHFSGAERLIDHAKLFDDITNTAQSHTTLINNDITIIINKKHYKHNDKQFLEIPNIPALPGFEEKRRIRVPEWVPKVDDPDTKLETFAKADSYFILSTSKEPMSSKKYSSRHVIVYKHEKSSISEEIFGYIPVNKLVPNHSHTPYIYGELSLGTLSSYKTNARKELNASSTNIYNNLNFHTLKKLKLSTY